MHSHGTVCALGENVLTQRVPCDALDIMSVPMKRSLHSVYFIVKLYTQLLMLKHVAHSMAQ